MHVFCKGFNLYGQLNCKDCVVLDFLECFVIDNEECFELSCTYSVIKVSNDLIVYCDVNAGENFNVIDSTGFQNIVNISANEDMILVLNDVGEIFKICRKNLEISNIPKLTFGNDMIKMISIGFKLNVACSKEGNIYAIPQPLEFNNGTIIALKTGREHCIILDLFGNIFTFGRGSRGQLGHGTLDELTNPKLIDALAGIKIVAIAAGGWHSVALSEQGDLYSWGWNANGQLGISEIDNEKFVPVMASPHVVDVGEDNLKILKVACGCRHTVALLENGILYGCGWNKYKQLKNKHRENYYTFTHLHDFTNHNVVALKCGPWNTAVICK